jgi:hypothetical protein
MLQNAILILSTEHVQYYSGTRGHTFVASFTQKTWNAILMMQKINKRQTPNI